MFNKSIITKIIVSLISIYFLSSCMTYSGTYDISLDSVEVPEDGSMEFGMSKIVELKEDGENKYVYEDDLIKVLWLPLTSQFSFTLENKTSHSIKLIWDETVYVDENGASSRVLHSGVKYIDRNNSQPSSIVIKKGRIDDVIVPTDNIYYVSGQYGGWRTEPLFENSAYTEEELNSLIEKNIGKTVKIYLPIEIKGVMNEYIFSFVVEDFIVKS